MSANLREALEKLFHFLVFGGWFTLVSYDPLSTNFAYYNDRNNYSSVVWHILRCLRYNRASGKVIILYNGDGQPEEYVRSTVTGLIASSTHAIF
jgi:hypothetical protein